MRERLETEKPFPELNRQFFRQCCKNLFAVSCPPMTENLGTNALADLPVKEDQCGINGLGNALTRLPDQAAKII